MHDLWSQADAAGLSDGAPVKRNSTTRELARSFGLVATSMRALSDRWDQQIARAAYV